MTFMKRISDQSCSDTSLPGGLGALAAALLVGQKQVIRALIAIIYLAASHLMADSQIWNNGAGNFQWNSSSANWSGSAWVTGNDAVFGNTGVGAVTLTQPTQAHTLTFNTEGYTINGSTLTLGQDQPNLILNASASINSGLIASNGIVKTGNGKLTLGGTNQILGKLAVNNGSLALQAPAALGKSDVAVANGAAISIATPASYTNALSLNGQGVGTLLFDNVSASGWMGPITLAGSSTIGAWIKAGPFALGPIGGTGDLEFWASSVDSSIVQTFSLTAPCSYSGNTILNLWNNNGIIALAGGANTLPTNTVVVLEAGFSGGQPQSATLKLNGNNQAIAGLQTGAGAYGSGGNNRVVNGSATAAALTVNAVNSWIFDGALGGPGANENNLSLVKNGPGVLTITRASVASAGIVVNGGVLNCADTLKSGAVTLNSGGTLLLGNGTNTFSRLTMSAGSTLGLRLGSVSNPGNTVLNVNGNLTLAGTVLVQDMGNPAPNSTLTVINYSGSLNNLGMATDPRSQWNVTVDTSTAGTVKITLVSMAGAAPAYYVSPTGNDANSGDSPEAPWQSLTRASLAPYHPGTSILLEGGQTFNGPLVLGAIGNGQVGAPGSPITIGSYGTGMATINGNGSNAITLIDTHDINIQNLTLSGANGTGEGISAFFTYTGQTVIPANFNLTGLDVEGFNNGIHFYGPGQFQNLAVTYSTIVNNGGDGIFIDGQVIVVPSQNILIDHDTIIGNGQINGPNCGVYIVNSSHNVVQYCVVANNGNGTGTGTGLAWAGADHVLVQYNECYENGGHPYGEQAAIRLDVAVNNIIQYNYTHDNPVSGIVLENEGAYADGLAAVRYNISVNDDMVNQGTFSSSFRINGVTNVDVYGNTIYQDPNEKTDGWMAAAVLFQGSARFFNNVVYSPLAVQFWDGASEVQMFNNIFYSGNPDAPEVHFWPWATDDSDIPTFRADILSKTGYDLGPVGAIQDPYLVLPGQDLTINNPEQLATLTGYKLQPGSPVERAGVDLSQLGVVWDPYNFAGDPFLGKYFSTNRVDFYGNPLQPAGSGQLSIGAYQVNYALVPATAPGGLLASSGNSAVTLSWNPVSGATTYGVKRATTLGGSYASVTNVNATGYSDASVTNGVTYYYVVSAGNVSGYSTNSLPVIGIAGQNLVANGSFSANAASYTNWPGYNGSANPAGPTGWIGLTNSGVNGTNTATMVYGPSTIPAGGDWAFIQNAGALTQSLPELTPGHWYGLTFAAASQSGHLPATFVATIGDSSHSYISSGMLVGNATAFQYYTYNFTTPASFAGTPNLRLENTSPTVRDCTVDFTTVSVVDITAIVSNRLLAGSVIGTPGAWGGSGNTISKVFDGDTNTYYDATDASGDWAGLNLGNGSVGVVNSIRYCPRAGFGNRMVGGQFQGANAPDFSSGVVTLFTSRNAPPDGVFTTQTISSSTPFQYVRYLGPANGYCNVAEVQFYGSLGPVALAAPGGLSAIAGSQPVALRWNGVSGATSYNVKRATASGGPYAYIANVNGTGYTDTCVTSGATSYYVVSAQNTAGEGPNSSPAVATPLVLPTGGVAAEGGQVTLSFPTTAGVQYQVVYKDSLADAAWQVVPPGSSIATGSVMTVVDPGLAGRAFRFYRLQVVSP